MKPILFKNTPKKTVVAVRASENKEANGDIEYDIYILTPHKIGSARRIGANKLRVDGHRVTFHTLEDVAYVVCQDAGELDAAKTIRTHTDAANSPVVITIRGLKLIARGDDVWVRFCSLRGLDPNSIESAGETFKITEYESKKLGLEYDGDNRKQPVGDLRPSVD